MGASLSLRSPSTLTPMESSTYPLRTSPPGSRTRSRSPTTRAGCPRRTSRGWSTIEKFKAEDEVQKERIAAKNGLESYCFNMKATSDDEKVKDKISEADKKAINDKCDEAIKWLDGNQLGEKEEFVDKQKEVEPVCSPI